MDTRTTRSAEKPERIQTTALTRERLRQYIPLTEELRDLEQAIYLTSDVVRGSYAEPPYTAHSVRITGMDKHYANWRRERMDNIMQTRTAIVNAVNAIQDETLRRVVILHYLNGLKWAEVARHVGRSVSTIRNLVRDSIK